MVITMLFSSLIGLAMGMLGGGGSVLTVPMLIGVGGLAERQALTTSLAMVVAMAAVAAVPHWRAGNVNLRQAGLFAALGAVGAALGGALSRWVPTAVLVNGFAVIMVVTGTAMLRGGRRSTEVGPPSSVRSAGVAVAAGSLTGLVGAGGGFVLVPALTLFAGLSMPQAVGTSLVVIAAQGAVALATQLRTAPLEISFVLPLVLAAAAASVAGARLARHVPAPLLKKTFGILVLTSAAWLLGKRAGPTAAALAVAGVALASTLWVAVQLRRGGPAAGPATPPTAAAGSEGAQALATLYGDDARRPA